MISKNIYTLFYHPLSLFCLSKSSNSLYIFVATEVGIYTGRRNDKFNIQLFSYGSNVKEGQKHFSDQESEN